MASVLRVGHHRPARSRAAFRTRVLRTDPSLHDAYDFGVGRGLANLDAQPCTLRGRRSRRW